MPLVSILDAGQGTLEDLLPRSCSGKKQQVAVCLQMVGREPGLLLPAPIRQTVGGAREPAAGGLDVCRCPGQGRLGNAPAERESAAGRGRGEAGPRAVGVSRGPTPGLLSPWRTQASL